MKLKKLAAGFAAAILSTTLLLGSVTTAFADEEEEDFFVNLDGEYRARIGIQGTSADGSKWYWRLGNYVGDHMDANPDILDCDAEGEEVDITFTDAEIKGNGTYTVGITFNQESPITTIKQLQVATDIPNTGEEELTFTNLTLKINGEQKAVYDEVFIDDDAYADDHINLLCWNDWRKFLVDLGKFTPTGMPTDAGTTYELTFTVSGFNYDNEEQKAAAEAAASESEAAAAESETVEESTEAQASDAAASSASTASDDDSSNTGMIIGIVVAVVVVLVIIIAVAGKKKKS